MEKELITFDNIEDDEILRRDFFAKYYDNGVWSYNVFQLRDITPPENYISLSRTKISPDAVSSALEIYSIGRLKKLLGYALLKAKDVRDIESSLQKQLLTTEYENNAHAGLFTWTKEGVLLEGSVESPDVLRLKKNLLTLAQQNYADYPVGAFDDVINAKQE